MLIIFTIVHEPIIPRNLVIKWYYLLCFCCFFVSTYLVYKHISIPIKSQPPFTANPENTVFVFDLHGVVFHKDIAGMIRTIVKAPLSVHSFITFINPLFWYDFFTLFFSRGSTEEIICTLAHKYPSLKKYINVSIEIANKQLPTKETVKIIKQLKQQGFRILIFSNIGITTFQKLRKKFPDIFSYFDGYQVTEPADNWIQKPHKQAYEKFINTFNLFEYNIVFIDDKAQNIKTAKSLGIYGIHFNTVKDLYNHIHLLQALP